MSNNAISSVEGLQGSRGWPRHRCWHGLKLLGVLCCRPILESEGPPLSSPWVLRKRHDPPRSISSELSLHGTRIEASALEAKRAPDHPRRWIHAPGTYLPPPYQRPMDTALPHTSIMTPRQKQQQVHHLMGFKGFTRLLLPIRKWSNFISNVDGMKNSPSWNAAIQPFLSLLVPLPT